jgi:hypothetical protein
VHQIPVPGYADGAAKHRHTGRQPSCRAVLDTRALRTGYLPPLFGCCASVLPPSNWTTMQDPLVRRLRRPSPRRRSPVKVPAVCLDAAWLLFVHPESPKARAADSPWSSSANHSKPQTLAAALCFLSHFELQRHDEVRVRPVNVASDSRVCSGFSPLHGAPSSDFRVLRPFILFLYYCPSRESPSISTNHHVFLERSGIHLYLAAILGGRTTNTPSRPSSTLRTLQ